MATYVVTQDGAFFAVRLGDSSGPVLATFSNRMAAETFAEKQRSKDQDASKVAPDKAGAPLIPSTDWRPSEDRGREDVGERVVTSRL